MATVTFIQNKTQSASAMGNVMKYVMQSAKTDSGNLVSGLSCSPQFAFQEFTATR